MLRQRVLTAVALLPLALAAIVMTPLLWFDGILVLVVAVLMREWARLTALPVRYHWMPILLVSLVFSSAVVDWQYSHYCKEALLLISVVIWLLCPIWFIVRRPNAPLAKLAAGIFVIAGMGVALHAMKEIQLNGALVLLVFLLVWAADVGAYFTGKLLGRRKLAATISPGKTWEGFFGGLALTIGVGLAAGHFLAGMNPNIVWAIVLAAVAIVSVIGDLAESLLKRQADVKDSGTMLPGHGGALDRLDSILPAAPMFLFFTEHTGLLETMSRIGQ